MLDFFFKYPSIFLNVPSSSPTLSLMLVTESRYFPFFHFWTIGRDLEEMAGERGSFLGERAEEGEEPGTLCRWLLMFGMCWGEAGGRGGGER